MRLFGTVKLDRAARCWVVEAEPHVFIRLKRVFERVDKHAHGRLDLSDTPENGRELLWFLDRYPMDLGQRDRAYLEQRSREFVERHERLNRISDGEYRPRRFELALPLRDYQAVAAELALQAGGLIIGDDLGLGKTAEAIGVIADPVARPALVVTATHLTRQWLDEIAKFAPALRCHVLKTARPYDTEMTLGGIVDAMRPRRRGTTPMLPGLSDVPDVIIGTYSKLAGWADVLAGEMRGVVFDEVQELRRAESHKYRAAKHIAERAEIRVGLSATPIYNYGSEIWTVTKALCPLALGTFEEFVREWCVAGTGQSGFKVQDPKALGVYLREQSIMLRRTRKEVGRELPPVQSIPWLVEADEEPLAAVEGAAAELARIILAQGGTTRRGEKFRAAEDLSWRLRQATGLAKAPHVASLVRMLVDQGEQVLLTGWHREVYTVWLERLADLHPVMFTGSESPTQKAASVEAFLSGEARVLVMSLRAGSGIDGLQKVCRVVVNGELDWSPKVHDQVAGRLHRDGQDESVVAYFPYTEVGSDPTVMDVLGVKRAQSDGIVNPFQSLVEPLDVAGGEQNMRKLAESYLRQRGLPLPAPPPASLATGTEG